MKPARTLEMHNYTVPSSPSMPGPKLPTKAHEKYSLRQRKKRKAAAVCAEEYASDNSSSQNEQDFDASPHKRQKCNVDSMRSSKGHHPSATSDVPTAPAHTATLAKAKTKAAPLSKYRRKTANARERTRMREINSAFENLRHCVPPSISGEDTCNTNEKLTKITTLRLAMKYISLLQEALENPSLDVDFLLECQREENTRLESSEQEMHSVAQMERISAISSKQSRANTSKLDKKTAKAKTPPKSSRKSSSPKSNANSGTRKTPKEAKRPTKQTKRSNTGSSISSYDTNSCSTACCSPISTISALTPHSTSSAYSSLLSATSSSKCSSSAASSCSDISTVHSLTLSHSKNPHQMSGAAIISDLSNLILESDGESLHLSEHCVSPIQCSNYNTLLGTAVNNDGLSAKDPNALDRYRTAQGDHQLSILENPFELSLSLLDSSSADSFDFAANQQPSSCLSPLVTYTDAFNPFGDLLHPDFAESAALDLFST